MKGTLVLLLTMTLLTLQACSPIDLTDKELDNACKNMKCFIKIYSPSCGHCKKMEPEWNRLAAKYCQHSTVVIGQIDGSKFDTILVRLDLKGFPSILLFEGGHYYEYIGDRSMKSMEEFLFDHTNSEMHTIPPNPSFMMKYYKMFLQAFDMMIDLMDKKVLTSMNLVWIPKWVKISFILFCLMLPTIFVLVVFICIKPKATSIKEAENNSKKEEKAKEDEKHTKKNEMPKEATKEDSKIKKE